MRFLQFLFIFFCAATTLAVATGPCNPNPCLHSGGCTVVNSNFNCTCATGYTGVICATQINYCASNPCAHGGACVNHVGFQTCDCTSGWVGATCQTAYMVCQSGYKPIVANNSVGFTCIVDPCGVNTNPCLYGSNCTNTEVAPGYECLCAAGFIGQTCSNNSDLCTDIPCLNGGVCSIAYANSTAPNCACLSGFHGPLCQFTNVVSKAFQSVNNPIVLSLLIAFIVTILVMLEQIPRQ
jgi:hypothetical protein